jgi:two-component system, chemotaxis family, chemotaxis protein CheY
MDGQGMQTMQTIAGDGADDTLRLAAVLDLAAAPDFLATLQERLADDRPLCLDASDVEILTLPCVQIILSAMQSCDHLTVRNPSEAFAGAFSDLALSLPDGREAVYVEDGDQSESETPEPSTGEAPHAQMEGPDSNGHDHQAADTQTGNSDAERGAAEDQLSEWADAFGTDQTDSQPMTKRILTIDDSKTMRDMLLLTLTDAGFEVLQGIDGQDGLDVLGEQRVDVIITDINMPRMDGYEVIRQLRSNPHHKTTPILVLTTESDTQKKSLARDAGATGWMVKPFDPEGLVAVINKVSP